MAGDLGSIKDKFVTRSGRQVHLQIIIFFGACVLILLYATVQVRAAAARCISRFFVLGHVSSYCYTRLYKFVTRSGRQVHLEIIFF